MPQAVLGNPHPPWQPISERDAGHVLAELTFDRIANATRDSSADLRLCQRNRKAYARLSRERTSM